MNKVLKNNLIGLIIISVCFVACAPEIPHPTIQRSLIVDAADARIPIVTPISICPDGMQHIHGLYCTEVQQKCIKYKDPPSNKFARCEEFAPTVCIGKNVLMDFCIDTDEYTEENDIYPKTDINYFQAKKICQDQKKRLCKETEWTLACEGESMSPYTTGTVRPTYECNIDVEHDILNDKGEMRNLSKPSKSLTMCTSPFGVRNMNGNVDELTERNATYGKYANALKGGHWLPVRNRCRPVTIGHDDNFHEIQIGTRCCTDTR
jgi:formylglycine-generating enzyme